MDGSLDTSTDTWRTDAGVEAPLGMNVSGQPLCPLCTQKLRFEPLKPISNTALIGCDRGHRFDRQATLNPSANAACFVSPSYSNLAP